MKCYSFCWFERKLPWIRTHRRYAFALGFYLLHSFSDFRVRRLVLALVWLSWMYWVFKMEQQVGFWNRLTKRSDWSWVSNFKRRRRVLLAEGLLFSLRRFHLPIKVRSQQINGNRFQPQSIRWSPVHRRRTLRVTASFSSTVFIVSPLIKPVEQRFLYMDMRARNMLVCSVLKVQ